MLRTRLAHHPKLEHLSSMEWTLVLVVLVVVTAFLLLQQMGRVSEAVACEYLKQGAKVIDVRGPDEFQSGHLPDALNIPLGELRQQISKHVPNKDQPLLLHCLSGGRSGIGRRMLRQMGYSKVFNLGGYGRASRIVSRARG
jgi:phage shock protein E